MTAVRHLDWRRLMAAGAKAALVVGAGAIAAYAPQLGALTAALLVSAAICAARPRLATFVFVWWTTFVTIDPVAIGPIPLKIPLLLAALASWYPSRTHQRIPFAVPVLTVAIGVPVVWSVVTQFYPHPYEGLAPSPTRMTLEHASRFLYLLIYFPLADYAMSHRHQLLWLIPVVALCALTWLAYVAYGYLGIDVGARHQGTGLGVSSGIGPLQGVITGQGQQTRVFFATHILLLPAVAATLAYAIWGGRRNVGILAFGLVTATLLPTQTRALMVGAVIAIAVLAIVAARVGNFWPVIALALTIVLLIAGPENRIQSTLQNPGDASALTRVEQAPELLAGWERHPLLGSGLGATLPTGYNRSLTQPYVFENTFHAMLFQNGILGVLLILSLPIIVVVRCLTVLPRLAQHERANAVAAVGGLVAVLAASTVTPYLVASYGMLALAALLAMGARAVHAPASDRTA